MRFLLLASAALSVLWVPAQARSQSLDWGSGRVWLGATAAFTTALALDTRLRRELALQRRHPPGDLATAGNRLGRPQMIVPALLAGYGAGHLLDEPGLSRAMVRTGAALVVAGALNGALKYGLGRPRPETEYPRHEIRPLNSEDDWQSLPSGHAVVAFAVATALADQARRPWVAVPAYGAAALVGWSRVRHDRHWSSDVVAGAIVGSAAAHWTLRRFGREPDTSGANLQLTPAGFTATFPLR